MSQEQLSYAKFSDLQYDVFPIKNVFTEGKIAKLQARSVAARVF